MDLTWPMTILPYSGGHQNWPIIGSHLHSFYGHQPAKSIYIYIYILFFRNVEGDHSSRSQYTMNYELSAADRERYSSWNGRDTRDGPQSVLHRGGFLSFVWHNLRCPVIFHWAQCWTQIGRIVTWTEPNLLAILSRRVNMSVLIPLGSKRQCTGKFDFFLQQI